MGAGELIPQAHGGAIRPLLKGETANPHGRPPKTLSLILTELREAGYERVTRAGVEEAYELLLGLDEEKLKDVIADKSRPMIIRIVGKAMLNKNGADMLECMLDRIHGKPKQVIDSHVEMQADINYGKEFDEEVARLSKKPHENRQVDNQGVEEAPKQAEDGEADASVHPTDAGAQD